MAGQRDGGDVAGARRRRWQAESIRLRWLLLRATYHYWYHNGENMGVRQALGHTGLPDFVGDIDGKAPYRPE